MSDLLDALAESEESDEELEVVLQAPGGPRLMVAANDLSVRYQPHGASPAVQAVNGASFQLLEGEILAVIGESGSGKSALSKVIAGNGDLGEPNSPDIRGGSLTVLGIPVRNMNARRRHRVRFNVGYLPQNAGSRLHPHLTAGELVAEPIYERDRRFNQSLAGEAVATLIDAVRLPLSTMNKYPYELSAGQKQRVAIARALILEPVLLVADDPTAGVDVTARQPIIETIHELRAERSFSGFIVTSNLWEVETISDQVLVMYRGVVAGRGSYSEVLTDPQHPYTQMLAKTTNYGVPLEPEKVVTNDVDE